MGNYRQKNWEWSVNRGTSMGSLRLNKVKKEVLARGFWIRSGVEFDAGGCFNGVTFCIKRLSCT
jgi:hypothetical protein